MRLEKMGLKGKGFEAGRERVVRLVERERDEGKKEGWDSFMVVNADGEGCVWIEAKPADSYMKKGAVNIT